MFTVKVNHRSKTWYLSMGESTTESAKMRLAENSIEMQRITDYQQLSMADWSTSTTEAMILNERRGSNLNATYHVDRTVACGHERRHYTLFVQSGGVWVYFDDLADLERVDVWPRRIGERTVQQKPILDFTATASSERLSYSSRQVIADVRKRSSIATFGPNTLLNSSVGELAATIKHNDTGTAQSRALGTKTISCIENNTTRFTDLNTLLKYGRNIQEFTSRNPASTGHLTYPIMALSESSQSNTSMDYLDHLSRKRQSLHSSTTTNSPGSRVLTLHNTASKMRYLDSSSVRSYRIPCMESFCQSSPG